MRYFTMTLLCVGLAACGQKPVESGPTSAEVMADQPASSPAADAAKAKADPTGAAPVKITLPQVAYSYKLGYLLGGDAITKAQQAHLALCNKLGPARCMVVSMERSQAEDRYGAASLKLRVASADAMAFSDSLTRAVSDAGGRSVYTNITADDVSKDMTDTTARIRQREILVERLTDILRKRDGKVADLVEAERSVAAAQEELDQAKSWLAELQGRVAYSTFEISYSANAATASPRSASWQLGDSLSASGAAFMIGVRAVLTLAIFLAPWALVALLLWFAIRRLRGRVTAETAPAPGASG